MILCEWDASEGNPGQSCVHLFARILSTSFTSVSIFSVWCYSNVSISMVCTLILRRANDTVRTRENAGVPYSSAPAFHSYLSDDHVRSASSKLPVAGISSVLQLSGLFLSSLLFDASVTEKIMAHCPSHHPAKVSKTPIRVNPLALYSLCGE
jgi:hypothetical protein